MGNNNKNEKKGFALGKQNFLLMGVAFACIILGFILMTGNNTSGPEFNPDIFSTRRITVGPMLSLFGFIFMIIAILWKPKKKED